RLTLVSGKLLFASLSVSVGAYNTFQNFMCNLFFKILLINLISRHFCLKNIQNKEKLITYQTIQINNHKKSP
ncbi:MAG: hypothetical protein ACTH5B_11460, partial [Marinomonas sp.]|uniref:hypothetical protein n=1 Tax=Marinomonas sp. TaxID=1904862 RepID=UPI003F9838FA